MFKAAARIAAFIFFVKSDAGPKLIERVKKVLMFLPLKKFP